MKAISQCPKCGETITTDCRACIEGDIYGCPEQKETMHECNSDYDIIENVVWKKIPENEKELNELEEEQNILK